jgi:pimeloyl-ACP methyl ester carboxylesterase
MAKEHAMTKTILLVHGAWLNALSWEGFKKRYEAKGYTVIAPSWPYDDRTPAELRAAPHPELAKMGPDENIQHFVDIIRKLPEQPLIIGHSAGGVYTQALIDNGLGAAGVAIDPAPTPGVAIARHALVSTLPVFLTWGSWGKPVHMSRKFFANRFAQTLPKNETDATYDRYIVPTSGKVYWQGLGKPKLNFANPNRAPLLFIAGGKDLIADASMTEAIYKKHKASPVKTEFKLYPDRSHWTCLDRGWEEVADYALDWAVKNAKPSNVTPIKAA